MLLFDWEDSDLVFGVEAGVGGGVVRLEVVTEGGGEVTLGGAGGDGINLSIFSHSALTCP